MKQKLKTWKRLVAEFFLILLGVSVAFLAEDFRETRGRQTLLREYMGNLKRENQSNIRNFITADSLINRVQINNDHFYDIHQNKDSLAQAEQSLRKVMMGGFPMQFYTGQWEALKLSGLLNEISDPDFLYQISLVYDNVYPGLARSLGNISHYKMNQMIPFYIKERAGREVRFVEREKIMSDEVYMLVRTYGTMTWMYEKDLSRAKIEILKLDSLLNEAY